MEEQKKTLGTSTRMSYEETVKNLEKAKTIINQQQAAYQQLEQYYKQAVAKLQEMDFNTAVFRVESCFKVLDRKDYFSDDFVKSCAAEIEEILTPRVEEPEEVEAEEEINAGE